MSTPLSPELNSDDIPFFKLSGVCLGDNRIAAEKVDGQLEGYGEIAKLQIARVLPSLGVPKYQKLSDLFPNLICSFLFHSSERRILGVLGATTE